MEVERVFERPSNHFDLKKQMEVERAFESPSKYMHCALKKPWKLREHLL